MSYDQEEIGPEEQPPMEVVLHEIRQMLLADMQAISGSHLPEPPNKKEATSAVDYFLLTPEMRYDVPDQQSSKTDLSQSVQEKAQQVLNKLSQLQEQKSSSTKEAIEQTPVEVSEMAINASLESKITEWLNTRFPEMLERIIEKEIQKALKK